ncbi:hypothetical protein JT359_17010 [Candidatus Poribacteria bacterium]|nr:hypothetical protein [Candidatus Poribacteria bacterium]
MANHKLYIFSTVMIFFIFGTFTGVIEAGQVGKEQTIIQEFVEKAQQYVKLNQYKEAIDIYERIVISEPENQEYQIELAGLYSDTLQHEKAVEIWNKLLEYEPRNRKYQEQLFNTLKNDGKSSEAIELAQAYSKTQPEDGFYYTQLARLYADEDNIDAAIANYEKAIEFLDGNIDTCFILSRLYFLNTDFIASEKALKTARQYASSEWEQTRIQQQLINLYRYQGNLEQTTHKIEKNDMTFEMQREYARLLVTTGELEKAVDAFKKAIELATDSYDKNSATTDLIKVYIKQGRNDLALDFFDVESSKHPRTEIAESYHNIDSVTLIFQHDYPRQILINAYKDQGALERLRNPFIERIEKGADNPTNLEMLADIYWNSYHYPQAADTYLKLSKVEPDNIRSYYLAAAAFHTDEQPNMVEKVLEEADNALATSKYKSDWVYIGALATICRDRNMYEPAIKLFNEAIAVLKESDNDWSLRYMYEILARTYLDVKRYDDSFLAFHKLANATTNSYTRNRAERNMKDIAKIANVYEKLIPEQLRQVQQNPNDPEVIQKLAEIYQYSYKYSDAVEQYEKLTILQPDEAQWYKNLGDLYQFVEIEKNHTNEVIEGTALSLGGNLSYVEIKDSETINNSTEQVTVSTWVKPNVFPNRYTPIIFKGDEWDDNFEKRSFLLNLMDNGSIQFAASPAMTHDVAIYSPAGSVKLNTWTHIAGVIDAKNNFQKLFINGIEVSRSHFRGKNSIYKSSHPLRIGWTHEENHPWHATFIGLIDDVRVWNIARTESEIQSDMNIQLKGDEDGLVGYWNINEIIEEKIKDISPNRNDGKTVGNVKLEQYTRPIVKSLKKEKIAKSIDAYEMAITLEPTLYENYDSLAQSFAKNGYTLEAETVYRRALNAPLTQNEHDSAIAAIFNLYSDKSQDDIRVLLEEIKPKMENSATLHLLLGDIYKNTYEPDKAELHYANWLEIRERETNNLQNARELLSFAEELLDKELFPETALKYAKRAFQKNTGSDYVYPETVGRACLANGLYADAIKYYSYALGNKSSVYASERVWKKILEEKEKYQEDEQYIYMLDVLLDSIPKESISNRANAHRMIAQFYGKKGMHKKSEDYTLKGGFVPENRWLILGPFESIDGFGHSHAYIPEEVTQIDTTAKYYGKNELISWEKSTFQLLDGNYYIHGNNDSSVAYFWATVISPDERDVNIRFDSDDMGTIWLNGKQIFKHDRASGVLLDRYIIPCTLKQGENTILLKVCQSTQSWEFYFRFTDADGIPYKDLKYKSEDELLNATPPEPTFHLNSILGMIEYYSRNNMHHKAMALMQQTGVIHEHLWLTLGPFDNTEGIAYDTEYIRENTPYIDITAKYEGVNGQISWRKFTDTVFDGFIDFGKDINWSASYALATVTSPDEREVQFRVGNDDQAKIWLNGNQVYANTMVGWALVDDNIFPVKLKAGKNTILIKLCNARLDWGFYLRITDNNGNPFTDLTFDTVQDK